MASTSSSSVESRPAFLEGPYRPRHRPSPGYLTSSMKLLISALGLTLCSVVALLRLI